RTPRPSRTGTVKMVVVGASTGGPAALARLVGDLAEPLPVPVLVTQHMPAVFTRQLADRLARDGRVPVHEAAADQDIVAGSVYIAPGGKHLEVTAKPGGWSAKISDAPPVNYCK